MPTPLTGQANVAEDCVPELVPIKDAEMPMPPVQTTNESKEDQVREQHPLPELVPTPNWEVPDTSAPIAGTPPIIEIPDGSAQSTATFDDYLRHQMVMWLGAPDPAMRTVQAAVSDSEMPQLPVPSTRENKESHDEDDVPELLPMPDLDGVPELVPDGSAVPATPGTVTVEIPDGSVPAAPATECVRCHERHGDYTSDLCSGCQHMTQMEALVTAHDKARHHLVKWMTTPDPAMQAVHHPVEVQLCTQCKHPAQPHDFCGECGQMQNGVHCQSCAKMIRRIDRYCMHCGVKQTTSQPLVAQPLVAQPLVATAAAAVDQSEAVDETGLDPDEVQTIVNQALCSRQKAVTALRKNKNIVDAILELTP